MSINLLKQVNFNNIIFNPPVKKNNTFFIKFDYINNSNIQDLLVQLPSINIGDNHITKFNDYFYNFRIFLNFKNKKLIKIFESLDDYIVNKLQEYSLIFNNDVDYLSSIKNNYINGKVIFSRKFKTLIKENNKKDISLYEVKNGKLKIILEISGLTIKFIKNKYTVKINYKVVLLSINKEEPMIETSLWNPSLSNNL